MKLTFWGAARTVTGSMHEVETGGRRLLLDCGLFQGHRKEAFHRNRECVVDSRSIHAVLLSHAHIDHSGNLPNLVRHGFSGPIYTSPATADLCEAMLLDSASLQERDAEFLNKRSRRRRELLGKDGDEPVEPLYTIEDAKRTLPLFRGVLPHRVTDVAPGVTYETVNAGHMLGSTSMVVRDGRVRLGFSGDVGRVGLPIIADPEPLPAVDYLVLESTYGDRLHRPPSNVKDKLADVIHRTAARGGRIVVPAFAVGRTQQLVVLLHELIGAGAIPAIPIFVDSPLAVNATEVFRRHTYLYDDSAEKFLDDGHDPFGFARLTYIRDVEKSKALNDLRGPFVVISASGMCEAGRILHHLKNSIGDPRNTVLLTGFQAENTLGRKLADGWTEVPIFGEPYARRCMVEKIDELSGHADREELLRWLAPIVQGLKRIFLVHGEFPAQQALKNAIESRYGTPVEIPARGDRFDLV
ncbi:MAG: MBL fold metallo-hydrolase [Bryobacteraceae bacterium]|nr:MBL fold metallo-hydrolase [Bryobacteraceae bacterium]